MLIYDSSKTAQLVNVTLKNLQGNTTTADGASADGLTVKEDLSNFVQCGQDTWQAWEMLKPYVKYIHVKDALADGNVVPSGHGIGNVERIVSAFRFAGGCDLSVEPHLTVFDGLKDLEQDGNTSAVGRHIYPSADAAFDAACQALKKILE